MFCSVPPLPLAHTITPSPHAHAQHQPGRPIMIIFNLVPAVAETLALLRLYYAAKRA